MQMSSGRRGPWGAGKASLLGLLSNSPGLARRDQPGLKYRDSTNGPLTFPLVRSLDYPSFTQHHLRPLRPCSCHYCASHYHTARMCSCHATAYMGAQWQCATRLSVAISSDPALDATFGGQTSTEASMWKIAGGGKR